MFNNQFNVCLPKEECVFCVFLAGPMALFMDQPTPNKYSNSVLWVLQYYSHILKKFTTVFLTISFQFLANKQYLNTHLV